MRKITALSGQTIYDIAVQAMGSVESVFDILALNPDLRLDTALTSGITVYVPDTPLVPSIVSYYKTNNLHPISGIPDNSQVAPNPVITKGSWIVIEGDALISILHVTLTFSYSIERSRWESQTILMDGSVVQLIADATYMVKCSESGFGIEIMIDGAWEDASASELLWMYAFIVDDVEAIRFTNATDPGTVDVTIKLQ